MGAIAKAAATTAAFTARAVLAVARKAVNVVYSPTMQAKTAQGATELANALFSQSNAYSPVTADKAADRAAAQSRDTYAMPSAAARAQYQAKDQAKAMEA